MCALFGRKYRRCQGSTSSLAARSAGVGCGEMLSGLSAGGGLGGLLGAGTAPLPPPGHVTVVDVAGDGGLTSALAAAQAAHLLSQFATRADHPRLVHIDLPSTITVPAPLAAQLQRVTRAARDRNTALGLSADSAQVVTDLSGIGSLLSTVFAFATSNPVETDRLRDLLGAAADPGQPAGYRGQRRRTDLGRHARPRRTAGPGPPGRLVAAARP